MKINCIIKNTKVLQQLELLVGNISDKLIDKDILPTPTNIYNEIRNLGVEVDLSTIGAIYAKNLSGTDATTYMTVAEVSKEIGADFNNTIKKIIQLNKGTKEIGKRSPAEAVAAAIANIFVDRNTPVQARTLMRAMQDIMLKGLKRHIPGNPVSHSIDPFDVARAALDKMAHLGVKDIHGQLNSLRDVFADVKIELDKQIQELKAKNAPASTIAQYENMIDGVQNSIYQLLLSKTEAREIITEAIKKYKNGIFTKTDKNGNVKLNYDALSGHVKSEQDLRDNVKDALTDAGFNPADIGIIQDSLAEEFKDAYANILDKATKKLQTKQDAKERPIINKSDLERLAQLHALRAFGSAHEKLIYELLGLTSKNQTAINKAEQIAQELNTMRDAGYVAGNQKERELNQMVNDLIDQARYDSAPANYKRAKVISDIFSMANLSLLNNIKNRIENWAGGEFEKFSQFAKRGFRFMPSEITALSKAYKSNMVENGGQSFGEMDMLFHGNTEISNKMRKKLLGWLDASSSESKEKWINWTYNQVMGTAALNGIDTLNKVQNTWSRFITNMEKVLADADQTKTKQEIRNKLHEQLFGNVTDKNGNTITRWEDAENKARDLIATVENSASGSILKTTPQMIKMLAADIVKAELINNQVLTEDQLNASWDAAYKAAGRAMGHVSNNPVSQQLQLYNNKVHQDMQKALDEGNFGKAATLTYKNILVNKIALKFVGGATNWLVLNLEKTGLRLIIAPFEKGPSLKGVSSLSAEQMEEALYENQIAADKVARGWVGATINTALFLAIYAFVGGDSEENKKRRRELFNKIEKNKWGNKYINILPMYITAYIAVQKQEKTKEGLAGTLNPFRFSPLRNYLYSNLLNRNEAYSLDNQLITALGGIFNNSNKTRTRNNKQHQGWETTGKILGNFFNVDPLPFRPFKDMTDILQGISGAKTKSDRDLEEAGKEDGEKPVWWQNMIEGYAKYGLTDW